MPFEISLNARHGHHWHAFIRRLLRALGMSIPDPLSLDNLNDPLRVGLERPVEEYVLTVLSKYVNLNVGCEKLFRVIKVEIRREGTASRHEYLVAHVVVSGDTHYIVIERLGCQQPILAAMAAAYDRVKVSDHPYKSYRDTIVETLNLSERNLYLHELLVAASHTHHCINSYKLFSTNCYWFVGSLMGLLQSYIGQELVHKSNRAGHWSATPVSLRPKNPEEMMILAENLKCLRQDIAIFSEKVSPT